MKNILGEFDSTPAGESSTSAAANIAPKPMKSIRKQATESEIEMKNYLARVEKKAQEVKKKSDVEEANVSKIIAEFVAQF